MYWLNAAIEKEGIYRLTETVHKNYLVYYTGSQSQLLDDNSSAYADLHVLSTYLQKHFKMKSRLTISFGYLKACESKNVISQF